MKKRHIGLDTYIVEFDSQEEMVTWADKNEHKWAIEQLFIENSYGLMIKKLRVIDI